MLLIDMTLSGLTHPSLCIYFGGSVSGLPVIETINPELVFPYHSINLPNSLHV